MAFLDLLNEAVLSFLDVLPTPMLYRIIQCNRRLYEVAKRSILPVRHRLYLNYNFTSVNCRGLLQHQGRNDERFDVTHAAVMLSIIYSKPVVEEYIRHIGFRRHKLNHNGTVTDEARQAKARKEEIMDIVHDPRFGNFRDSVDECFWLDAYEKLNLVDHIRHGDEGACSALLLAVCKEAKTVKFEDTHVLEKMMTFFPVDLVFVPETKKLTPMTFHNILNVEYCVPIEDLNSQLLTMTDAVNFLRGWVLQLPNLKHLTVDGIEIYSWDSLPYRRTPAFTTLENVNFRQNVLIEYSKFM